MKAFFEVVRAKFGPLTASQVIGLNAMLKASDHLPLRHQAYVLATAWHETGPAGSTLHMTPRREIWGPTAAQKRYEGRKDLGNTLPGDGKKFAGRGYVQITGRANYHKASQITGQDLVANPDMALNPEIAARIIINGMSMGWFTGRKMADFQTYREMRKVVNGTDKADLIAGYAETFEKALIAGHAMKPDHGPSQPVSVPPPPDAPPVETSPSDKPSVKTNGIYALIAGALMALAAAVAAWLGFGGTP